MLSPEECGSLIPHWPDLEQAKLDRLARMTTRVSYYDNSLIVMGSPPILVVEDGYIINGKHRAVQAYIKGLNTEACSVDGVRDIRFHTSRKTFGELDLEQVLECFVKREMYMRICAREGILTIADLAKKYLHH